MFFPKKKKSVPKTSSDNRAQYRKRATKAQRLEALLRVEGWEQLQVELVDLTIRGAGVRVPFVADRNLEVGAMVELVIGNMMRKEIVVAAKVANVKSDGDSHIRYGFEFVNLGNLYSQLDQFYARHFNRRRHPRVFPALDRKIHANLGWNGGDLRVHVYDVSETGIGLVLTRDSAARVLDIPVFDVRFKLPGTEEELHLIGKTQHRTPFNQQVLLGLHFENDGGEGAVAHMNLLREFVKRRSAEMAQWESKTAPPKKS